MSRSSIPESQQIAEQSAPVVSGHTPTPWKMVPWHIEEGPPAVRATAGHIVCTTASNDDAAFIVRAVNSHEALVKALEFIRDGYDNQDVNHVDFRVKAYQAALDALASAREVQP